MDNNSTVGIENYANFIQRINTVFNLSLPEIKNKYEDYPLCLLDYLEKGEEEKAIEIRFDKEEITITCLFNAEGKCNFIYLFSDNNETVEVFVSHFKETFDFDYMKKGWITPNYYIQVRETGRLPDDICLAFYC